MLGERDPDTTYRVALFEDSEGQWCEVTVYPPYYGKEKAKAIHRLKSTKFELPKWMRDGIHILDVAGYGVEIPGIGTKGAGAYWFETHKETLEEKLGLLNAIASDILKRLDSNVIQE